MFKDRTDAGIQLAGKLVEYAGQGNVVVLALPRGGAVTGIEIARKLKAAFDVLIVRKIGHPWQPELAVGAVSETGTVVYNEEVVSLGGVTSEYLDSEIANEKEEILRRQKMYRAGRKPASVKGKTVILTDDGIATGATMKAAVKTLKEETTGKLVVAVPVAPLRVAEEFKDMVDRFVCLETPGDFMAVGSYYWDFTQVTDLDVMKLIEGFRRRTAA